MNTHLLNTKSIIKFILIPLLSLISSTSFADLQVRVVNENSLPYEYSPMNYDNSPMNYDNSPMNYDNSEMNYDNSPSNYDNSSSNYENTAHGGHKRIILNSRFYGYYVYSPKGIMNIFSARGERMFYSPPKTSAVFHSQSGEFVGAIARSNDTPILALTNLGYKLLITSN